MVIQKDIFWGFMDIQNDLRISKTIDGYPTRYLLEFMDIQNDWTAVVFHPEASTFNLLSKDPNSFPSSLILKKM